MISNVFILVTVLATVFLSKTQTVFGKSLAPHIGGVNSVNNNHIQVKKLPSLNWSPDNYLFNDHESINYYLKLNAHIGDSIDLICGGNSNHQNTHSIIYKVSSKHEFDNCIVNPQHAETVPILKCGSVAAAAANSQENVQDDFYRQQQVKFTIYFVKFSPVPNALEFEEDKEYYFLSTSSGTREGLNYMSGGLCSNFNMRFSIKIDSTPNLHQDDPQRSALVKQQQQQHISQFQASILSSMHDHDSTRLTPYNSNEKSHIRLSKNGGSELSANTNRREETIEEDGESERAKERLSKYQPQVSSKLNIASSSNRCSLFVTREGGGFHRILIVLYYFFYNFLNRFINKL